MVLREHKDPLNTSRGIMGPLENTAGVQNNRGRLKQRFDLIRKLGQGTYGKVQLGIDKETGQEVAIKTIKKSKIETEADLIRIRREIQIMSSVRHPNIIHIYEVFENREKMVLVMEYAAGGELYDYLNERKILQDDEARRIFRQIASAVYYCHKNKICHRDLKLENILLDQKSNAKIADFGLSNVFDDINLLKTFCGSPLYASPEIVKGTPYSGPEVDCWSLGVLLYTLVYGAMPFDGSNFKRLVKQISAGDYYEPKKPAEASALIRRMLTVDPKLRAKVDDICSHLWINNGFELNCLTAAEDLAKQTPVRLDVLLTLAPNHNVTHSQVVIPPSSGMDDAGASGGQEVYPNESNTDISEPPKKPKLHGDKPVEKGNRGEGSAPSKPKRKVQTKTKSKSSPLLELIQDVVEEEAEDVEMQIDPAPQDDDEGDTLSEISEIQTLAEDLDGKGPSRQKSVKSSKAKVAKVEKDKMEKPPVAAVVAPASVVIKPKTESAASVPPIKDLRKREQTPVKEIVPSPQLVKKPVEPAEVKPKVIKEVVKAQDDKPVKPVEEKVPKPAEEKPPKVVEEKPTESKSEVSEAPKVIKKKVIKPKTAEEPEGSKPKVVAATKKSEEFPLAEDKPKISPEVQPEAAAVKDTKSKEVKVPEPKPSSESEAPSDGETKERAKLVKQRSGSASDVSPTRIERRNSKVISQKTAELIQNLETKTTTSSGGSKGGNESSGSGSGSGPESSRPPGIKKLVIPSFKVSDAKSKFETKPPRPITASVMSHSKAAFEAKAQQAAQQEAKKVPPSSTVESKTKSTEESKKEPSKPTANASKPIEKPSEVTSPAAKDKPEETKTIEASTKKATPVGALAPTEPTKSPAASPKTKPKVVKKPAADDPAKPVVSPAGDKSTAPKAVKGSPIDSPQTPAPPKVAHTVAKPAPGKAQVPTVQPEPAEVKPVITETGKVGPKPVTIVTKVKPTPPSPAPSPVPEEKVESQQPEVEKPKLLTKVTPQNKEQAAKKISSMINKIVSSSSGSDNEKKFATLPKVSKPGSDIKSEVETKVNTPNAGANSCQTEVSFPVAAAQSQERVIPIKFVEEDDEPLTSPPVSPPPQSQHQTPSGSRTSMPRLPPRLDSFKRFDASAGSIYSRQDSSDAESCSLAPPMKMETIRKSPREFLIPIKLEASGTTVMPKEDIGSDATGGSEDEFRIDSRLRSGRFGRQKRYSSLLSDSSLDEEPSVSISTATSRRPSTAVSQASHARSRSQGDEPETPTTTTFKRHRVKRPDLDRSDSFSSAEEDDEDFFEVLTADSLFTNLLDRVRNLTKRLNKEGSMGPNWPTPGNDPTNFGLWNPSSSLRDLMNRAPSESRNFSSTSTVPGGYSVSTHRSFSREPSVTVTMNAGGGPSGSWRRSLSRDISGDSESSLNPQSRSYGSGKPLSTDIYETTTVRSLPLSLNSRRSPSYMSQRSDPYGDQSSLSSSRQSMYSGVGSDYSIGGGPSCSSTYSNIRDRDRDRGGSTSRPAYSRTLSNSEYSSPSVSRTLPIRRSLKSYDRSSTSGDFSSSSSTANNSFTNANLDSVLGVVRGLGQSLIDSPSTFDPDSYLRQLKSSHGGGFNRDREPSVYRLNSISEQHQDCEHGGSKSPQPQNGTDSNYNGSICTDSSNVGNIKPVDGRITIPVIKASSLNQSSSNNNYSSKSNHSNPGEINGSAGGFNSNTIANAEGHRNLPSPSFESQPTLPSTVIIDDKKAQSLSHPEESDGLSIHEKMNNYQQYYQSLSQSPLRRSTLASPSQIHGRDASPTPTGSIGLYNSMSRSNAMNSTSNPSPSLTSTSIPVPHPQQSAPSIGLARFRPSTMYETSFVDNQQSQPSSQLVNCQNQKSLIDANSLVSSAPTVTTQPSVSKAASSPSPMQNSQPFPSVSPVNQPHSQLTHTPIGTSSSAHDIKPSTHVLNRGIMSRSTPSREMPNSTSAPSRDMANSTSTPRKPVPYTGSVTTPSLPVTGTAASTTAIPKWPGVSIQQYRPLSISSFPDGTRASSVSRVMSPPPAPLKSPGEGDDKPGHGQERPQATSPIHFNSGSTTGPKKREVRATSVERITRFLERKSVPREINVNIEVNVAETRKSGDKPEGVIGVEVSPTNNCIEDGRGSPEKASSKLSKPKFLQSLEKKWEKFTSSGQGTKVSTEESNGEFGKPESSKLTNGPGTDNKESLIYHQPSTDEIPSEDNSLTNEEKISESVLLRRALSPEKKLSKKFGSGTVNSMLGKFMRFEEPMNVLSVSGSGSKIPAGKPPPGSSTSRIGRRVQSVYAGAMSDSVLALPGNGPVNNPEPIRNVSPRRNYEEPNAPLLDKKVQENPASNNERETPPALINDHLIATEDLIRSAEIAQQKRRSLRLDTKPQETFTVEPLPIPTGSQSVGQKLQRPISLGVFSEPSSKNPSLIPRPNQYSSTNTNNDPLLLSPSNIMRSSDNAQNSMQSLSPPPMTSNPEPITAKSMSPPEITVHTPLTLGVLLSPTEDDPLTQGHAPMSPNSISESCDSSSVCSDRGDLRMLNDGEEESVSDRILRKSFYSRFNSIDRAKRSASLSAAAAVRKGVQPLVHRNSIKSQNSSSSHHGSHGHSSSGGLTSFHNNNHTHLNSYSKAQSVERPLSPMETKLNYREMTLQPRDRRESSIFSRDRDSAYSIRDTKSSVREVPLRTATSPLPIDAVGLAPSRPTNGYNSSLSERAKSPSPHSFLINKYNPNPLFKELITDEFKSDVHNKTEYSRRVTSKLSKLLREIESDLGSTCSLNRKEDDDDYSIGDFSIGVGRAPSPRNGYGSNNNPQFVGGDALDRKNRSFSPDRGVQDRRQGQGQVRDNGVQDLSER